MSVNLVMFLRRLPMSMFSADFSSDQLFAWLVGRKIEPAIAEQLKGKFGLKGTI
jgi:hypothetical protein